MKKTNLVLMAALAAAGVVGVTTATLAPAVAVAAEEAQKLSSSLMKPLKAVESAMKDKNWEQALAGIREAQAVQPQTPYDTFIIDERAWYIQYQLKDIPAATAALERSVNSGFLSPEDLPGRLKALTQLSYQIKNYANAAEYGNRYLADAPDDREIATIVAYSYYNEKDYSKARDAARKLIATETPPDEQLLVLELSCNQGLNDEPGTVKAVETLVRYYPKEKYWNGLLTIQLYQTKDDRELRTLFRLMEQTKTLDKAEEFSEMANVLFNGGFPAEAAGILERGISGNVFTGEALTRAKSSLERDRAGAATDRKELPGAAEALASAKTGNEMVAIGKLYFSFGDYGNAADAIRKGLAKGGVSDTDDANALLGIALVRSGKPEDAKAPFGAVKDPKYVAVTRLWVLYVDSSAGAAAAPAATEAPAG
jgi:tetratricopeptide (TPR) repeat protein